jgi:hypothetical protein
MIHFYNLARENALLADKIVQKYVETYQLGGTRYTSKESAETAGRADPRYKDFVAGNQMYDRWHARESLHVQGLIAFGKWREELKASSNWAAELINDASYEAKVVLSFRQPQERLP